MRARLQYARWLHAFAKLGIRETAIETGPDTVRMAIAPLTPNDLALIDQEVYRVMYRIYAWQRQSGQRITGGRKRKSP